MDEELRSLEDLAKETGASVDELSAWRSLGLIGAGGRESFTAEDAERVRFIQFCARRGFAAETIALAERTDEGFLRRYIEQVFPNGIPRRCSVAEAAELVELDVDVVHRLQEIVGRGESIDADDVEMFRGWKVALEAGLPEEAMLQLVRVYSDSLGRVAEAEARLFHFYVHERLREGAHSTREVVEKTEEASQRIRVLAEPAILYFHRKGMAAALRDDMLLHLAEYCGQTPTGEATAQMRLAVVFLDLASFTPLTESMGDVAAANVVARFSELVRNVVNEHHGRLVERIGDAFMLTFPDAESAIACALEIQNRAAEEPQFPAVRGGVHVGSVLYREGGYVGSNVNIAARVAAEAKRRELLVTLDARKEASRVSGAEFVPLGKRRLKGVTEELELFEVRPRMGRPARMIDPVCGMELTDAGVAARLSIEGADVAFCSERCLRSFVESRSR
jgi:class 3 adenylate cyclase/YHS domain-containing protein